MLYLELILFKKDYFERKKLKYFTGSGIKFNMGCGRNVKDGWTNVDLGQANCINLDLREKLPFADGIASQIYSEHMLEHFAFPDEALTFISESFRLL
jgi:predicted SAM-dependent methyltransferase